MTTGGEGTNEGFGEFTEGEQAFFNSGGEDTDGLDTSSDDGGDGEASTDAAPDTNDADASAAVSEPADQDAAANGADAKEADGTAPGEDDGDITIEIGADGKARDLKSGKFVPHAALHKERVARKALAEQNQTLQLEKARVEARIETLNEAIFEKKAEAKPDEAEKEIDPEEDIFGALRQTRERAAKLEAALAQRDAATQQQNNMQQVQNAYVQDAVRFSKENDDFPEAYRFVKENLHKEMQQQGVTDKNVREAMIKREEAALVQNAFARGASPAEAIYQLASGRGYAKAAPKTLADDNAKKLASAADGQKKAQTLSGKGSGGGEPGLTYEALAAMSDDEMYSFSQRNPAAYRKMMNGGG